MRYSKSEDYFQYASKAVLEMHKQQPNLVYKEDMLQKGLIIRHLVLPKCRHDSMNVLKWIYENLPEKSYLISLMSQYTPSYKSCEYPEINREISTFEYNFVLDKAQELGLDGFMQEKSSAKEEYTPDFDFVGI